MKYRTLDALVGFALAAAVCFIVFLSFIGSDANFQSWEFNLTFYRIEQPVTWAFPVFFSLGFAAMAVLCNFLLSRFRRYRNAEGLQALEALLLAKLPLLILTVVFYIAFRPPNFSLSIGILAVFIFAAIETVLQIIRTVRLVGNGRSNWKSEINQSGPLVTFGLVAASIMIGLVLIEVALRVHNPFSLRVRGDKIVLQTNHKYIINNNTPGKLEKQISVSANSLGFRGEDPPVNFEDYLSIVAVGGSTTENSSLSDDKTWVSVMGRSLQGSLSALWVNNAGFAGHSTTAHRLLIDDYLAKLKPDIIVFLIGINDLGKDGLGRESMLINSLENAVYRKNNNARQFFDRLADYSELANLANNMYRRYQAAKAGLAPFRLSLEGKIARDKFIEPKADEAERFLHQMPGVLEEYAQRVKDLIARSRSIGAKPVLITQPLLIGPGTDPDLGFRLDNIEQQLLERPVSSVAYWQVLERYNDVVRHIGKEMDIPVIDVARKLDKRSSYYIDIMHFSVKGADRVGKLIADGLCPWLIRTYPRHRTGDACPEQP